jgi:hypothetical protein
MTVDLWQILTLIVLPAAVLACGALWRRIENVDKERVAECARLWAQLGALQTQLAAAQLENERRYVNQQMFATFSAELFRRIDRVELKIDNKLQAAHSSAE